MKMTYTLAQKVRRRHRIGKIDRIGIAKTYGMNPRAVERLLYFNTYKRPIKKRSGVSLKGESCGRSKLTERDARCIYFLRRIVLQEDLASDHDVSIGCIKNIHGKNSWKGIHNG